MFLKQQRKIMITNNFINFYPNTIATNFYPNISINNFTQSSANIKFSARPNHKCIKFSARPNHKCIKFSAIFNRVLFYIIKFLAVLLPPTSSSNQDISKPISAFPTTIIILFLSLSQPSPPPQLQYF